MTARYRLSSRTFLEPYLLEAGSIIETDGEPGESYLPLNEEARHAKERWFRREVHAIDAEGKPLFNPDGTPKTHQPNLAKRPRTAQELAAERPTVEIISGPAKDDPGMSLAEAMNTRQSVAPPVAKDPLASTPKASVPSDPPVTPADNGTKVVSAAPPPPVGGSK